MVKQNESFTLINYAHTSQYPPLSGPTRFNFFSFLRTEICFSTALVERLNASAISLVVISLFCLIKLIILSLVFSEPFSELFSEPLSLTGRLKVTLQKAALSIFGNGSFSIQTALNSFYIHIFYFFFAL